MGYRLGFTKDVQKQMLKRDKHQVALLRRCFFQNSEGSDDPRELEQSLKGDRQDQWRYRVGNDRIIVDLQDDRMVVLALQVGHRKNIYH